ncbi:MAG: hypothetical protein MZW92_38550 [Comamonadaceae bacterium]|nr:hypothetical protein [Comamonadaceae bacterium]
MLNALQADFPLVSRPFEALGSRVGIARGRGHRSAR